MVFVVSCRTEFLNTKIVQVILKLFKDTFIEITVFFHEFSSSTYSLKYIKSKIRFQIRHNLSKGIRKANTVINVAGQQA